MIGTSHIETASEILATGGEVGCWSTSSGKRVFDFVLASAGLLLLMPVFLLVALVVKLSSSKGPVFFRQVRVGRGGKHFELLKFCSMRNLPGAAVTREGDPRITPVGKFLRRTKLDELPQLINVVSGHMSLVGPRPDLPQFWSTLPASQRAIMNVRPGITGRASLQFRDEEQLLASVEQDRLHDYYVSSVLPVKVQMDLEYAQSATLVSDLVVLLSTLARICR